MRLALFEPDIPQNTGTLIRLGACLGLPVDIIEPTGFAWSDKALKRAGLDYWEMADVTRHNDWTAFNASRNGRLVLLTTKSTLPYTAFTFQADDILLLGRESAGVPPEVHAAADARLTIPMRAGARSVNVAVAATMVIGECLRQTAGFPEAKSGNETLGDKK
ncbi:MAG: tRNA (cytidine(34)-2'-O)-methyltransferase [Pseudomonadota bacterium]